MDKHLEVKFYRTGAGNEPVRRWLKELSREDKKRIGDDIFTVQTGWPIGMPTCRPLRDGIQEVRTDISSSRISRILFWLNSDVMYLLHGFIKKTRETPKEDLELAIKRKNEIKTWLSELKQSK